MLQDEIERKTLCFNSTGTFTKREKAFWSDLWDNTPNFIKPFFILILLGFVGLIA